MGDTQKKKGFNIKLFLFSLVIVLAIVWPVLSAIKASNPDISVTKTKITKAELAEFQVKITDMVAKYTVRFEGKVAIVHPPANSDVYLLGRNYDWGNYFLELEQGKPYRLHLASLDMRHALVIHQLRLMHRMKLGKIVTVSFAPDKAGRFDMRCGDYCGPKHDGMIGTMIVTAAAPVSATRPTPTTEPAQ